MRRWAGGVLAALTLAGCGSGGLSSGQLAASAGRLCKAANQRLDAITLPSAPSGGQVFLRRGIAVLTPEVAELRELGATGTFRDAVTATGAELTALRSTLTDLHAGNDPVVAIKTLQQQLLPLEAGANLAWQSLGVRACVSR